MNAHDPRKKTMPRTNGMYAKFTGEDWNIFPYMIAPRPAATRNAAEKP